MSDLQVLIGPQSLAARHFGGGRWDETAEALGIEPTTLLRFHETSDFLPVHHTPDETVIRLRKHYEDRGVQFIDPDRDGGPGLRLSNAVWLPAWERRRGG